MNILGFLCLILKIYVVQGIKCFVCDSESFPGICGFEVYQTHELIHNIADCSQTCFVGALKNYTDEAYLRKCGSKIIGCDKRPTGFICQCSTDFCNQNLETCKSDNDCPQKLFPFVTDTKGGK